MTTRALHQLLDHSASRFGDRVAIEQSESGSIRYDELARLSDRVRDRLRELGVGLGDRVGICARKSGDVVAAIFGIMKSGCGLHSRGSDCAGSAKCVYFSQLRGQSGDLEARLAEGSSEELKQLALARW